MSVSRFGGVPLNESGSQFGGIPIEERTPVDTSAAREQALTELAQETGPGEAALVGMGRGFATILRGLGLMEKEDPATTQSINMLKEEHPIATGAGEIAGEAAPFIIPGMGVSGLATIPARVMGAAALGSAEAGLIAKGSGENVSETFKTAGIGGAFAGTLELALPIIGRIGGKLIRRVLKKDPTVQILDAGGNPSLELREALEKSGLTMEDISSEARRLMETGDIVDNTAVLRKEFLESHGLIPTRAQVTGSATDFQRQQELYKKSNKVRFAIEGQEEALGRGFDNAITMTGGSSNKSNSPVFDFIADRSIEQDAAVSAAYKQARELAADQKIIKVDNLVSRIKTIAGSDRATGGLASAARDILKEKGVLMKGKLKNIGRIDATVAEQIRIDLNALYKSLTPFGRSKLRVLKDAIDLDVGEAVGEDVFLNARAAKAKFEKELSRAKINKFDNRKKNLVRDILENKINPDRFLDEAVLSKTVRGEDLEQLKRFLINDEGGIAAWNDLRAEALFRIKHMAFNEVGGDIALSRANMERALDRFGTHKLKVLFSAEENKFLQDMLKVSKIREPKRGTALGLGPSAQAITRLEETIKRIPAINQVFEGAGVYLHGRQAVGMPDMLKPIQPSPLTLGTPAAIPLIQGETDEQR